MVCVQVCEPHFFLLKWKGGVFSFLPSKFIRCLGQTHQHTSAAVQDKYGHKLPNDHKMTLS